MNRNTIVTGAIAILCWEYRYELLALLNKLVGMTNA